MKITKENLRQAIAALRQCAQENKSQKTDTGAVRVSDLCSDVADYLDRRAEFLQREVSGIGPMLYLAVYNRHDERAENVVLSNFDIEYPRDCDEEREVIRFIVLKHSEAIFGNRKNGDEDERRLIEKSMENIWLSWADSGYRDCATSVKLDYKGGSESWKIKVTFSTRFLYD